MSKMIYPNDPCPCGSGKKFKKCCIKKLNLSDAQMDLRQWVFAKSINEDDIEENTERFQTEQTLANDQLMSMVCNVKICFAKGMSDYEQIKKNVNTTRLEYSAIPDEKFKLVFVEAASQFVAQMNGLTEDEFVMVHNKIDIAIKKQFPELA